MSALSATANPRRIKASHRRRRRCTTGHRQYANNNPYRFTDPDGRSVTCDEDETSCTIEGDSIVELAVDLVTVGIKITSQAIQNAVNESSEGNQDSDGSKESNDGASSSPKNTDADRNPSDDQRLSKGEIKALDKSGQNAEDIKGGKATGKLDLFKDKDGNVFIKPKDGSGPGEPTGININDVMKR